MKKLASFVFCLVVAVGSGWAGVTGTTNPGLFNDSVDWCVNFGCLNNLAQYPSPQSWISNGGVTGEVGLVGTLQGFYNLQQGVSWGGIFTNGMGLVYNGSYYGNTPTGIAGTVDTAVNGIGAYIEPNYFGPFTASIELFDSSYQSLGIYTVTSNTDTGSALFIGAFGSAPVWAAQFTAYGVGPSEPDFAIGEMKMSTVPEPSSLLLLGSSALGLAGVLRRRFKGVL